MAQRKCSHEFALQTFLTVLNLIMHSTTSDKCKTKHIIQINSWKSLQSCYLTWEGNDPLSDYSLVFLILDKQQPRFCEQLITCRTSFGFNINQHLGSIFILTLNIEKCLWSCLLSQYAFSVERITSTMVFPTAFDRKPNKEVKLR